MNDETAEAQKARVRALFDAWIPLLRLQGWRYLYQWDRGHGSESPTGEALMECDADWRYLSARITVYLGTVEDVADEALAEHVIHELLHIHLNELRLDESTHNAHEERVATQLARAFLEVRNHFCPEQEGVA